MYEKKHLITCGDARICCFESGAGQPVVLLHGNGESSAYWANQAPVLVRLGFRVLAMDSRGHGESEHGGSGLSFDLFADDLRAVMDALGVPKAHIVGFSDGGNLALKFALKYPASVEKLVLNGANIEMLRGVKPYTQLPLYPVVGMLALAGKLHRISAPALVVVGEHDMIRDAHSRRIADELPHGSYLCLGGTSHFCAAEAPARFNRALVRFLLGQ